MLPTAYYFTFGLGTPLARYYVQIFAPSEHHARCLMFALFSHSWAGCYTEAPNHGEKPLDVKFDASVRLQTATGDIPRDVYVLAVEALNGNG